MKPWKKYRINNMAKGLCKRCPMVAVAYGLCVIHLAAHRIEARKQMALLREKRKKIGLCSRCGAKLDSEIDSGCDCMNCTERKTRR